VSRDEIARTERRVAVTADQFRRLDAAGRLTDPYSWGHCGPLYLDGLVVDVQESLGQ
jgi:hypothetical protein